MKENVIPQLEAILFISGEAVTFTALEKILDIKKEGLQEILGDYAQILEERNGGLVLITDSKSARLGVASDYTSLLESLVKNELQSGLSKAALEVLALVAYLAPVARVEVDAIRGVNSSFTLRNLAMRGLIERKGNPNDARGYIYEPSMEFLTTLGIENITKLPGYQELRNDERLRVLQGKEVVLENNIESEVTHEEA